MKQWTLLALFTLSLPSFADTVAVTAPVPTSNTVVVQNVVPNNDCVITASVLSAINADPELTGQTIRVSTLQGVVSLDGTVASPEKVTEAIAQARGVSGVVNVKSYLNVQGASTGPNAG